MVQEYIEYYQGFITEDLTHVSDSFLDSTQFAGSAGDLMALTLMCYNYQSTFSPQFQTCL